MLQPCLCHNTQEKVQHLLQYPKYLDFHDQDIYVILTFPLQVILYSIILYNILSVDSHLAAINIYLSLTLTCNTFFK